MILSQKYRTIRMQLDNPVGDSDYDSKIDEGDRLQELYVDDDETDVTKWNYN
jgi:hypothetical protein